VMIDNAVSFMAALSVCCPSARTLAVYKEGAASGKMP
jgi:hypothetical protein